MSKIDVGDRVAYSKDFLRSIGMIHDCEMGHALGVVEELTSFGGKVSPITLAHIKWDHGFDLPEKVAVPNLRRVGRRAVAYARVSSEHQMVGSESYCVLCDRAPCICEIGGEG